MPRKIAYSIILRDKFSRVAGAVVRKGKRIRTMLRGLAKEARNVEKNWQKMGDGMKSLGRKMSLFSAGIVAFGLAAIVASARNESLLTSFKAISGSAEVGKKLLKDLYTFAAKTPFEIEGLGESARMLLATGTAANDIIPIMSVLGDIASVTNSDIGGLARVWFQIGSANTLETERANQLADRGIDIFGAISRKLGEEQFPVSKVRKLLEKRLISADFAHNILREMTQKGGVAYKAMELESATVAGMWSNIKDTISQTMQVIGDVLVQHFGIKDILTAVGKRLDKFKETLQEITDANPRLTKMVLGFVLFMTVLGPIIYFLGMLMAGYAALSVAAFALSMTTGALALTFFGIAVAIMVAGAAIVAMFIYWEEFEAKFRAAIKFITIFVAAAAAIWTAVTVVAVMTGSVGVLTIAISVLSAVFSGIAAVFGLAFAPITLVILGIVGLFVYWTEISNILGAVFDGVINKFSQIVSLGKGAMGAVGGIFGWEGSVETESTNKTEIDVNLNAPNGVIKSATSKSVGSKNISVGLNMAGEV